MLKLQNALYQPLEFPFHALEYVLNVCCTTIIRELWRERSTPCLAVVELIVGRLEGLVS